MTRLGRLDHAREYLDEPGHNPAELEDSLSQVAAVNRWLGGRRALLRTLVPLLPADRPAVVLDAGTGSADLPRAIVDWARRHGREVACIALDRHPQILAVARRRCAGYPEISVAEGDALALPLPDDSIDLALLSLTLHHFEGDDRIRVLRELHRVARRAVVVNELERAWPNYLGARLLAATVWRHNRLTRHDGPISVRRSFTAAELLALGRRAGLPNPRVSRFFPWRVVLVAEEDGRHAR